MDPQTQRCAHGNPELWLHEHDWQPLVVVFLTLPCSWQVCTLLCLSRHKWGSGCTVKAEILSSGHSERLLLVVWVLVLQGTHESLDESLAKETPEEAAARLKKQSADTRSAVM